MKRKNRFVTTEIYPEGIHAVHKVIVDTQTHVAYYLHQEGSGSTMCLLVDRDGKPMIVDEIKESLVQDPNHIDMRDRINSRKDDEALEKIEPVKIKKKSEIEAVSLQNTTQEESRKRVKE